MDVETIDSLRLFLDYGATGIAGLMLLLVVITLLTATITPAKERILKRFMLIGAFCFAVALASQVFLETRTKPAPSEHMLTLEVIPHDSGQDQLFPPPIIKMGGSRIDRTQPMTIKSNATLIVDLFDGVDLFKAKEQQVEAAQEKVEEARVALTEQNEALKKAQSQTRAISAEINNLKAQTANVPGITPRIETIDRDLRMIDRGIGGSIKILP